MKTITMDYSVYEDEIEAARRLGQRQIFDKYDEIIKNTTGKGILEHEETWQGWKLSEAQLAARLGGRL